MRRRRWTGREIEVLAERYQTEGPSRLAKDLGRSEHSITSQANRLGYLSLTRRLRQSFTRVQRSAVRTATSNSTEREATESVTRVYNEIWQDVLEGFDQKSVDQKR
jgi:DNA-binding MarR family transcriptional regulator